VSNPGSACPRGAVVDLGQGRDARLLLGSASAATSARASARKARHTCQRKVAFSTSCRTNASSAQAPFTRTICESR